MEFYVKYSAITTNNFLELRYRLYGHKYKKVNAERRYRRKSERTNNLNAGKEVDQHDN